MDEGILISKIPTNTRSDDFIGIFRVSMTFFNDENGRLFEKSHTITLEERGPMYPPISAELIPIQFAMLEHITDDYLEANPMPIND